MLPAEFAQDAQLKLRFEREATTISQLNHPRICALYDVGDQYLVMELLDGQSLAQKLAKAPLPIDQVLRYGIEIAEALEKAHKSPRFRRKRATVRTTGRSRSRLRSAGGPVPHRITSLPGT